MNKSNYSPIVFLGSLEARFLRDDYEELVELSLLALGAHPDAANYTFKFPGANHRARWMARVIYCIKIFLFRKEINLSPEMKKKFKTITLIFVLIYGKNWTESSHTIEAAANDLCLYKQLKE
jgi:hypothetical protein